MTTAAIICLMLGVLVGRAWMYLILVVNDRLRFDLQWSRRKRVTLAIVPLILLLFLVLIGLVAVCVIMTR